MYSKLFCSNKAEYQRVPESGWQILRGASHVMGQISYNFINQDAPFKRLIINAYDDDRFSIKFDKPKIPDDFERRLKKFDCHFDPIQLSIQSYYLSKIDCTQLIKIVYELENIMDESLLLDIKCSTSSDNEILERIKEESQALSTPPPTMIFATGITQQSVFNKTLHELACNKNMACYSMSTRDLSTYIPVVQNVLKNGADPNSLNDSITPLMGLVRNQMCTDGTKQIANLLFAHGANINAKDGDEKTVLHHALENTYSSDETISWIVYLLEHDADATLKDSKGCTPREAYLLFKKNACLNTEISEILGNAENRINCKTI